MPFHFPVRFALAGDVPEAFGPDLLPPPPPPTRPKAGRVNNDGTPPAVPVTQPKHHAPPPGTNPGITGPQAPLSSAPHQPDGIPAFQGQRPPMRLPLPRKPLQWIMGGGLAVILVAAAVFFIKGGPASVFGTEQGIINVTGTWNTTLSYSGLQSLATMNLQQRGTNLTGTIIFVNSHNLTGSIAGQTIKLHYQRQLSVAGFSEASTFEQDGSISSDFKSMQGTLRITVPIPFKSFTIPGTWSATLSNGTHNSTS